MLSLEWEGWRAAVKIVEHSSQNEQAHPDWNDVEKSIWKNAEPYIDDSLPDLQREIPELRGLISNPTHEPLPVLLAGIGKKCVDLLERTPNVIADEKITTQFSNGATRAEKFGYLVVVNRTSNGGTLKEYRTDKHGLPVSNAAASGEGFASMWVHLFPANQDESRFRYLGEQQIESHKAIVIAFAQIPDKVRFPADFHLPARHISVLYQGLAWVDAKDLRIICMREDLLRPRPDVNLTDFTAVVRFGPVIVKKAAASLWLPQEADLNWTLDRETGREKYRYSRYRLYAVKTKIVPLSP